MRRTGDSRKTSQELLPVTKSEDIDGYDIYPTHPLDGPVREGYEELAVEVARFERVALDGYVGVLWDEVRRELGRCFEALGHRVHWIGVGEMMRPEQEIDALVAEYLGDDPVFGKRFPGELADFFAQPFPTRIRNAEEPVLTIVYGPGAGLALVDAPLVYFDVPKNEIQYRARAGTVGNLGKPPGDPKEIYRRCYFVDWPVLDGHKRDVLERIDLYVDSQRPGRPTFTEGSNLRRGLCDLATSCFRVRPWFSPGAWGGEWIRENIPGLSREVPNYAWSFELITPENGLIFEGDGRLLEASFDLLMYQEAAQVLGRAHERFGDSFPIRFDFLDTVEGGNLSLQCHPRTEYIRQHFGEAYTQDETYYMLHCEPDAKVYLGFEEDVAPSRVRGELERSQQEGVAIEVDRYVQSRPARKHELYLIPNGTVHCSGRGNLVLEISATPYIFTFKMYDWMRLDLDGKPRPLNIARAFENLDFSRAGEAVERELISRPCELENHPGWSLEELPTHPEHFYEVVRYTIRERVTISCDDACHIMSLVEGTAVSVTTEVGRTRMFRYVETFVVPAAAQRYTIVNEGHEPAVVVQARVKRERATNDG